jgi:glyoxylase-like metal-dependent hydrolase (beta-lactamase superfamily II)
MQVNCYILGDEASRQALIIDPGDGYSQINKFLDAKKLKPLFVINTHGHVDHIGADEEFGVPVYIHRDDVALLKDPSLNLSLFFSAPFTISSEILVLEDNQEIRLGESVKLKVIHTPGHTAGSISLLLIDPKEKKVFTGDTLFCEGVGRTDFPGASESRLVNSIKKRLLVLDDDTVVYPGHGPITSIGHERESNPFLS